MFDRLEWWQVLLLLAPVVLAMQWIRYRETTASSTSFRELTAAQKAWVLLSLLPPGAAARLLHSLDNEQRESYLEAGAAIRGSGRNLVKPVVRELVSRLDEERRKQAGGSLEENLAFLGRWAESQPKGFSNWLTTQCPPPRSGERSARLAGAPAEVANPG